MGRCGAFGWAVSCSGDGTWRYLVDVGRVHGFTGSIDPHNLYPEPVREVLRSGRQVLLVPQTTLWAGARKVFPRFLTSLDGAGHSASARHPSPVTLALA